VSRKPSTADLRLFAKAALACYAVSAIAIVVGLVVARFGGAIGLAASESPITTIVAVTLLPWVGTATLARRARTPSAALPRAIVLAGARSAIVQT
jgi:hypothetical protein